MRWGRENLKILMLQRFFIFFSFSYLFYVQQKKEDFFSSLFWYKFCFTSPSSTSFHPRNWNSNEWRIFSNSRSMKLNGKFSSSSKTFNVCEIKFKFNLIILKFSFFFYFLLMFVYKSEWDGRRNICIFPQQFRFLFFSSWWYFVMLGWAE